MRFSIIVPAYNAEKYLDECLSSVSAQVCRDFELIAVDDGSTDRTGGMLDSYACSNRNTCVLHGSNQGLLLARRKGLSQARGDYVVFLDADDRLRPDALELIGKAADQSDADVISFQFCRDECFSAASKAAYSLESGVYTGSSYIDVKRHVCMGRFNNLCGKAIRRSCIDSECDYSGYAGLMHGEDLFQLLPIIDRCGSLCQMDDVLYYYRPSTISSTACYKPSQLSDIVQVNQRLRDYADRWGVDCPSFAAIGETNQYLYLVKLNELSNIGISSKRLNFASIAQAMRSEGVFGRAATVRLRSDNKVLMYALERDLRIIAAAVVHVVEVIKRC